MVQGKSVLTVELNDRKSVGRFQNCIAVWDRMDTVDLKSWILSILWYLLYLKVKSLSMSLHVVYPSCSGKNHKECGKKSQIMYEIVSTIITVLGWCMILTTWGLVSKNDLLASPFPFSFLFLLHCCMCGKLMEDKILGWILRVHFFPQSNLIKFLFLHCTLFPSTLKQLHSIWW